MKTVLMQSPNDLDGVSLYRHWGPMLELERQGFVRLIAMPNDSKQIYNWQYYKKCHFAFCHRPSRNFEFFFIQECRKHGLPVWVDFDDNTFSIPDDNDAFFHYSNEEAYKHSIFALKAATVITTATPKMVDFFKREFNLDADLVENALDDNLIRFKKNFKKSNKIMWRGSVSHNSDLDYWKTEIMKLIEMYAQHEWTFQGLNPWFISRRIENAPIQWAKTINFIDYIQKICKNNAAYNWTALIDSEFNRCRSHNGWIETTLAGSITLAPDWDEWKRPGIINYKNDDREDFLFKFSQMLGMSEEKLVNRHNESWEFIKDCLLLSKINNKRLEIISNI